MSTATPELSVVVALISGRVEDLARCLAALHQQQDAPSHEVLVPYDPPCRDVLSLTTEFPEVRFLEAAGLDTGAARKGGSREHHDTLRTLGLRNARGRIIALTEDHAVATPTWCADMVRLLDQHPAAGAVGGAVECGLPGLLPYAVYLCDFGRYQNPLPEGPAWFVSDSNVAYRRDALAAIEEAWSADYHETLVHDALRARGCELILTPRSTVHQTREGLKLGGALKERYVWGRSFAGTRVKDAPASRRILLAALTPALPLVMTWRLARGTLQKRRQIGRFLAALPIILLLQSVWALGELVGYVTARPDRITGKSALAR